MKRIVIGWISCMALVACNSSAPEKTEEPPVVEQKPPVTQKLYLDVHNLEPGKVKFEDVMGAHKKDLAVEGKYGVDLKKFWVDEKEGKVYCLASASNPDSLYNTHKEAHGLLPAAIFEVTPGEEAALNGDKPLFLDVHELGPGNVTAAAVADAHKKDLAVQGKYGVNLLNYWVDEKKGVIMCLAQASDSTGLIKTHKEAHGLLAAHTYKVKQGE
jgi:hypothetical protein